MDYYIERDQNIINLENQVFSKIKDLFPDNKQEYVKKDSIRYISVEDAIKELIELEKNIKSN